MKKLKLLELIKETFLDKHEEILELLIKYELEGHTFQVIDSIDSLDPNIISEKSYVSSLSSAFLTNVNSKVSKVEVVDDKKHLEYILGELSKQILVRLIIRSNESPIQVIEHMISGLEVACKLNDWNYGELEKTLNLELIHKVSANTGTKLDSDKGVSSKETICYYDWIGTNIEDLKDLALNLKDRKSIKSTAEFMKLFSDHDGTISVRFNRSDVDFIIVLFDELKNQKLIAARGNKAKHFTPLKRYSVDFERNVLIKTEPKHLKSRIVKNKSKHQTLKESALKWLQGYK